MANKCVPMGHCGNIYPGLLNGTHATVVEGVVTRRVCFSTYQCCSWYQNIRVKNCGAYFVYALPRLYYYYHDSRYCGNGRAGKILSVFLIISLSKVERYFSISSNATVKDALIDINIGFLF